MDHPYQLQDRSTGHRRPANLPRFDWTLANYEAVLERSNYGRFLWNSIVIAGGSTILGIMIAVPAAWSMAFVPGKRTKDILLWMLSTKMLPAVGVLYPIYLLCIQFGVLDSKIALVIILMLINLPIIVWMLYTYFREIPGEILEAARMDGASLREEVLYVLTPMAVPGIASTLLLNFILAWNEAFWTLNLTAPRPHRSPPSSRAIPAPRASSTPSSARLPPWPSRQSSSSAGSARNNSSAA